MHLGETPVSLNHALGRCGGGFSYLGPAIAIEGTGVAILAPAVPPWTPLILGVVRGGFALAISYAFAHLPSLPGSGPVQQQDMLWY